MDKNYKNKGASWKQELGKRSITEEKHSSLLHTFVNKDCKFFITLAPSFEKFLVNFFVLTSEQVPLSTFLLVLFSALFVRLLEHIFFRKNIDEKDEWTRKTKTKVQVGNRNWKKRSRPKKKERG
jgi:hypothetical protein